MGSCLSVDGAKELSLQDLFRLGESNNTCNCSDAFANAKHHIKAWEFTRNGNSIADSPISLLDENNRFSCDLLKDCSYLILHLQANDPVSPCSETLQCPESLQQCLHRSIDACTPRGLGIDISAAQVQGGACGEADALWYSIFVWHGKDVEATVKAKVLTKAFQLDRLFRLSKLSQKNLGYALKKIAVLNEPSNSVIEHADEIQRNRLLWTIAGRRTDEAAARASGVRFPCLGKFIGNLQQKADRQSEQPFGNTQTMPDHLGGARHQPAGSYFGGSAPSGGKGKNIVPKLPLGSSGFNSPQGMQTQMEYEVPRPAQNTFQASAQQTLGAGPQQGSRLPPRIQGMPQGTMSARPHYPGASGSTSDQASNKAPVPMKRLNLGGLGDAANQQPKSARTETGSYPDGRRPRGEEERYEGGSNRGIGVPGLSLGQLNQQHHTGPLPGLGLNLSNLERESGPQSLRISESSDSSNSLSQGISARSDAPAMLNLEEINMSEEDLINSYDPKNEENNYHLPHHLFKQLQLDQFRVQCSEIIPGKLYISGHVVASDREKLKAHKITHIVNTAADVCDNCFPEDFEYLTYYLKDTNLEDISIHFYRTLEWIQDAMSKGGRVMVHCREGVSRSSTMIIAYLMWIHKIPFEKAHEMVRDVRPICNPNTGFTCCLLQLAKKLGVHGPQNAASMHERLEVFRVAPYHPREPFIMLHPVTDWKNSPKLDPRFGYFFQKATQAWGWIGSQCCDLKSTQTAIQQHVGWLQRFENFNCTMQFVHEGHEPAQMWQMLDRESNAGLVSVNLAYDNDAELMRTGLQGLA